MKEQIEKETAIMDGEKFVIAFEGNLNIIWEDETQAENEKVYSWINPDNEKFFSLLNESENELYFGERTWHGLEKEIENQGHTILK